ncbi:YihY/virulence factor BrkB family protein [Sphingomonas parva]|uniref:YihY/virulence factor BrkB family protein n=1 Tax=Sphingomonas parva TaxID=2555898 RepID=A0A4Y8ZPY9_9SPHN|nr:YihY/virulence factor BrkB family protein [Sphingomonas parva]TFI58024.1 YihY/virulence factor BrkB family protein [Sphingomonas parva]
MQTVSPESPEARRKRLVRTKKRFGKLRKTMRPGEYTFEVLKRVAIGVYSDGFIHAGNLAYLALMTIFPFIIVAAAAARLFGQTEGGLQAVTALLQTMPPDVADVLRKPISDVLTARSGNLLWLGALVGLWTTGSFIETIRDILHRAYGVVGGAPFWEYRLLSIGLIVASVLMMLVSFSLSIVLSSITQFIVQIIPRGEALVGLLNLFRVVPGLILFGSIYLIFVSLTPRRYRRQQCKKWPGALFVTLWWLATTALLPVALSGLGSYDLTYGSLAGVIIALFFFFVIGFGVVIGAQLNAALAEPPEASVQQIEAAKGAGETA